MNNDISFSTLKNEDAYQTPKMSDEYPFWICQYGHTYSDKTYHEVSVNSPVTRIEYIVSGKGVINSKNISCIVNQGDTYILHEGDNHNYYSDLTNPLDKIWINVKGKLVQDIMKIYHLNNVILFKHINSKDWIENIHTICKNTNDPYIIQSKVSAVFLNMIQFLSRHYIVSQSSIDFLDDMRSYIDLHIQDNITIEDLTKFSKKSPEHTIRLFNARFGMTPHKYILKSKLQLAQTLLHSSNDSVEKISEKLNFCNVGHFSKIFNQYIGIRPSEYRKAFRKSTIYSEQITIP